MFVIFSTNVKCAETKNSKKTNSWWESNLQPSIHQSDARPLSSLGYILFIILEKSATYEINVLRI